MKILDALQLVAAIGGGCKAFLTNNRPLRLDVGGAWRSSGPMPRDRSLGGQRQRRRPIRIFPKQALEIVDIVAGVES